MPVAAERSDFLAFFVLSWQRTLGLLDEVLLGGHLRRAVGFVGGLVAAGFQRPWTSSPVVPAASWARRSARSSARLLRMRSA